MSRPTFGFNAINHGLESWDTEIDTNFTTVVDFFLTNPVPLTEHVGDETDLASTFTASLFDRSVIWVDHTILSWVLYYSNGTVWSILAPAGLGAGVAAWEKFTVLESAFTAAATSEDIELFSLPAGGVVHAVKTKHSVSFTGGGATSFTLSVGPVGDLTKYSGAFDVFQAVSATVFQISSVVGSENHGATTSIRLAAVSDVNVGDVTAGSVDVWVLKSTAV